MQKWAKFFLIAAVATLFFRYDIVWFFKPYELLLLPAIVLTVMSIKPGERREALTGFIKTNKVWLEIFLLALLFSIAGTLNGYRLYGPYPARTAIAIAGGFFYFVVGMATFFIVIYYGNDRGFRRKLFLAFCLPVIFIPFIFIPTLAKTLGFAGDAIHFEGLHDNPVTFAFLISFALAVLTSKLLESTDLRKKVLDWLLILGLLALTIWTGARSAWLLVAVAAVFVGIYLYRTHPEEGVRRRIKRTAVFFLAVLISITIAFLILPQAAKIMALDRFYPQISGYFPAFTKLRNTTLLGALAKIKSRPLPSLPYQSRGELWPQALKLFVQNPLGLGPEYFRLSSLIKQGGIQTHSHNTILQAGLVGGLGLLILYLLAVWKVAVDFLNTKPRDFEWLTISIMLMSSLLFSMIGELLYIIPWIWVAAALAVAKRRSTSPKEVFSAS